MTELPPGTVTFLFTDVEGSTRLLRELGAGYADALAAHRRRLRAAAATWGGVEVDTQGDAFFFAFPSADDAIAAAGDAQIALGDGPLSVRMGLHTGEPELTREGYVGLDVHLGARIAASAHGGQVVLSGETARQLDDRFPLRDLGEHRVKDFTEPVWVYQLGDADFPPLRTISNTNLPRPSSSFVGREAEVREVAALLTDSARLVTLTGPGGSGKTRLAIEAAAELVSGFASGVFWVGLADIRDPSVVVETIARCLGARDDLATHLRDRELLLLLDNFEQVADAAPELTRLLEAAAGLRVLVTSREVLRIAGEVEFPVSPLAGTDAVSLFCSRARCEPDEDVRRLCEALDDLPLAIELAAARVRVLTPAQIVERISERLDLFVGGRDADPRQRTLRATIEWSHELLAEDERRLFADLAVFEGGFTFEAAESVAGARLDALQDLAEKSLVRRSGERFWMLETIRVFAAEQLRGRPSHRELERRHSAYFGELADGAQGLLEEPGATERLVHLEDELPNLRAAVARDLAAGRVDAVIALAGSLTPLWVLRGHLGEGRRLLESALAAAPDRNEARARALTGVALVAALQGDWEAGERWSEAAVAESHEAGEAALEARALTTLGRSVLARGDTARARMLLAQAAAVGDAAGRPAVAGMAQFNLGWASLTTGEGDRARRELEDALARFTAEGYEYGVTRCLSALAAEALRRDAPDEARALLDESLALARSLGDPEDGVWALGLYGIALVPASPHDAARVLGAAEAAREDLGLSLHGVDLELHDRALPELRSALDPNALSTAWQEGRRLQLPAAVDHALAAGRAG